MYSLFLYLDFLATCGAIALLLVLFFAIVAVWAMLSVASQVDDEHEAYMRQLNWEKEHQIQ